MAALLGLSPWANAYDLWLEKTGKTDSPPIPSGAAEDGLIFESGVAKWAERHLGQLIKDPKLLWFPHKDPKIHLISHPDALVKETGNPVEIKTSGLRGPLPPGWGEPGTDQIPDYYICQAQVHMLLTEKKVCHVPAYLGGHGPAMFQVIHNPLLQELIVDQVVQFWDQHVKKDVPPPDTIPHIETAKRMIRIPGLLVKIDPALADKVVEARAAAREADLKKKVAEAEMMATLGEAEGSEDGRVTYFMQHRAAYEVAEADFRVLRIKKGE